MKSSSNYHGREQEVESEDPPGDLGQRIHTLPLISEDLLGSFWGGWKVLSSHSRSQQPGRPMGSLRKIDMEVSPMTVQALKQVRGRSRVAAQRLQQPLRCAATDLHFMDDVSEGETLGARLPAKFLNSHGRLKGSCVPTTLWPAFSLPRGEAGCSLKYLIHHFCWSPLRKRFHINKVWLKLAVGGAVGDIPRTEAILQIFFGVNWTRLDVPAALEAAAALHVRRNNAAASKRVGVVTRYR
jgi:hypothetical protein